MFYAHWNTVGNGENNQTKSSKCICCGSWVNIPIQKHLCIFVVQPSHRFLQKMRTLQNTMAAYVFHCQHLSFSWFSIPCLSTFHHFSGTMSPPSHLEVDLPSNPLIRLGTTCRACHAAGAERAAKRGVVQVLQQLRELLELSDSHWKLKAEQSLFIL